MDPTRRGEGLGRLVTETLVEDARAAGAESVTLGVRGNNHAAEALYRSLGFVETGVQTATIAVGNHRFDGVDYQLSFGPRPELIYHDRRSEGPGAS